MRFIHGIDRNILYIMLAIPTFLYVHGFLLSGVQIFQFKSNGASLQVKQNITVKNEVQNVEEVLESQVEREKLLAEKRIENRKFDKAVSLSTKLGTVKDINKEKIIEKEDSMKVEEEVSPIIEETPQKAILNKPRMSSSIYKQEPEKKREVSTSDRLIIKRSASILDEKEQVVKTPQTSTEKPVFKSLRVGARFVESGRVEIGKDNVIFIRNTEPFQIRSGQNVPKNTVMTGYLSVKDKKLKINISKIAIEGHNYRTDITVCDANGSEGIALSDVNELFEDSQDELDDIINGSLDNINLSVPMLGSISLPSIRRKDNNRLQVFFDKATEIKLLVRS